MAAVIPCLFLVLGLVLPGPVSRWTIALGTIVVAVAASIMVALLISMRYLSRMEGTIAERLATATRTAMMQADGVWQVWSPDQLSRREREMDVKTIWIIGHNIASDITDQSPFLDVVKYNMQERGIRYVYIVPREDPKVKHQLTVLSDALGDFEGKEDCFRTEGLDLDTWERMPYTAGNITIYDPSSGHVSPIGYFWYPGGDGHQFGRLGGDVIEDWVSKVEELCPGLQGGGVGGPVQPGEVSDQRAGVATPV